MERTAPEDHPRTPLRRCLEATVLVAIVIGIGLVFDMAIFAYVAMSFPAAIAFQLWVRGRPLHEMWVRRGPALSRATLIPWLAVLFAIPPLISLMTQEDPSSQVIWTLVVIAGSVPASYVVKQRGPDTLRYIVLCLATGGLVGALLLTLNDLVEIVEDFARAKSDFLPAGESDALAFAKSFVVLWPGYYVVEEVLFRGVIDSHVHHEGERHWLLSAIFVSLLWGAWHLPVILEISPGAAVGVVLANMFVLQGLVGPFLSYWWRRSGNLLVPAVTHDFLDSLRNATGTL
jgi:membrane protease YdiL (CAAX protease family)